ncbi:MAG TPA: 3-methyl-2-oxobutanoate dehydrogenase subunit VorB [Treponemataceae bacterium]|nr:3-methyl-2-oxobutanoate dehydrogenase subunit VorB [Treponemataceae bacterium]
MSVQSDKRLMKGNEAIAEAAIRAGCAAYFGYPITPQNELIAWMADRMPELGRVFIQAESEISAVNMVYGAASTGARAMTSSSSPGISLKQEGISYAAGADIPFVYVNMVRGGPGLGSIAPAQSDYIQSTRGGGHGDYRVIVLAPNSVQEAADLTYCAFDLAEKWRMPVLILGDGVIGQMMEGVELPPMRDPDLLPAASDWAVGKMSSTSGGSTSPNTSASIRSARHITSLELVPEILEEKIRSRFQRYSHVEREETRYEETFCDDAELIVVAYGTSARVALGAVRLARDAGLKAGLLRPITLWPFPSAALSAAADRGSSFLSVEMSMGQMRDDIRLSVKDRVPVDLLSHAGGVVPSEEEVFERIHAILGGKE